MPGPASGNPEGEVHVQIGGQEITAAITAEDLGLSQGAAVKALVKSTEISLAAA